MTIPPDPVAPRHGGDLAYARAHYGTPPEGWLDLSTGINPIPYPAALDPPGLAALPDRGALDGLIAAARVAYQVPPGARLIAAPGSEIALRLLPFVLPDGPVAIVGPTYGSHDEAWSASHHTVSEIATLDVVPADATTVVLANPNNPDGRTFAATDLARLASALAGRGGMLVVDEAFTDLDPDIAFARLLDRAPAIVLRSFGKFFGLAGLRLGFVGGPPATVDRLARLLGDWPVSNTAIAIGQAALADRAWQNDTRNRLAAAGNRLRALLNRHRLRISGGTDLFALIEHADAVRIHHHLAELGVWTRVFSYRCDWLRIGLPSGEVEFARLDAALSQVRDPVAPPSASKFEA